MTIVLQYLPYFHKSNLYIYKMNSSTATTTAASASNKNETLSEAPKTKTPMCDNCNYRPVTTDLSCKVYDDWCALCNLSLLSTNICTNCECAPVSTTLSYKVYDDWCASCNLSLLSTKDSE